MENCYMIMFVKVLWRLNMAKNGGEGNGESLLWFPPVILKEMIFSSMSLFSNINNENYHNDIQTCDMTIFNYIKSLIFSLNACITYKILLIIFVTVVYARKYFKIKIDRILLKINYIRRKLSGLAIINWKQGVNKT